MNIKTTLILLCALLAFSAVAQDNGQLKNRQYRTMERYSHISENSLITDVMQHPAFNDWGSLIFPWDDRRRYARNMTMADAPSLHLWHTNMHVGKMVDGVNRMIDDINKGENVFYDFYSDKEKNAEPTKKRTGLFFFRGRQDAPFAVICPGGGFYYVGSLHEGFPLAMELNRKGYNAFVLKYRVGQGVSHEKQASQDLIAAVDYIRSHAHELRVSPHNYSVWGGSAGARMCSNATYGEGGIKRTDVLHPAAAIIAYTYFAGHPSFNRKDPPAYLIVGTDDWIVPHEEVKERAKEMRATGIDVECHILRHTQHGFGVGEGTPAEGWMNQAVEFWERHFH